MYSKRSRPLDPFFQVISPFSKIRYSAMVDYWGASYMLFVTVCCAAFACLTFAVAAGGQIQLLRNEAFKARSQVAQGRVFSIERLEGSLSPSKYSRDKQGQYKRTVKYQFEDASGKTRLKTEELHFTSPPQIDRGTFLDIHFDPDNPDDSISAVGLQQRANSSYFARFFMLAAAAYFLLFVIRFVQWKRSKSKHGKDAGLAA